MPRFKPPAKQYALPPKGLKPARCYAAIDLGTQPGGQYGPQRKLRLSFELVGTQMPDDAEHRPFSVHATMTLSYGQKARLRAFLESWFGRSLDADELKDGVEFGQVVGMEALVQIVHDQVGERTYANIKTISPPMDGQEIAPMVTPPALFSLDEPSWSAFDRLTPRTQEQIKASPEYEAAKRGGPPAYDVDTTDEDLGF